MSKIKGVSNLNNAVSYIVKKYTQAEVDCYMADEFSYSSADEEISFSLIETARTAETFCKFINKNGGKCNDTFDEFTYSILHEIGHYYTLDDMNNTVYKLSHIVQTLIEKVFKKTNSTKIYSLYYYLPHEIIASKYAIDFDSRLFDKMKRELKREIICFYQKNGVDTSSIV